MVVFTTVKKDPDSHLLFPIVKNKKVNILVGETIGVRLYEGKSIIGVVDEISKDREHFYIRADQDPNSRRERCSFRLDQIIKLN